MQRVPKRGGSAERWIEPPPGAPLLESIAVHGATATVVGLFEEIETEAEGSPTPRRRAIVERRGASPPSVIVDERGHGSYGVGVDAHGVYWVRTTTNANGFLLGELVLRPRTGGAPITLVPESNGPIAFAADDQSMFVLNLGSRTTTASSRGWRSTAIGSGLPRATRRRCGEMRSWDTCPNREERRGWSKPARSARWGSSSIATPRTGCTASASTGLGTTAA